MTAGDGAVAECRVPFPPLRAGSATDPYGGLVAHALAADRRVGVLLVRLGGHAAGVFAGDRPARLQGRLPAGARPQRRRRAVTAALRPPPGRARSGSRWPPPPTPRPRSLVPAVATLDAVVLGGDRRALDPVLADPRLAPLLPLVVGPRLDVPDPRRKVLEQAPRQFRAVRVRVAEPTQPAL